MSNDRSFRFLNIGFGNVVNTARILTIISPDSAPVKRMIHDAEENSLLIDATFGRRTRAVIVMDSGHLILCPIMSETVAGRIEED